MPEGKELSYSNIASNYNQDRFTGKNGKFLFEIDNKIIREFLDIAKSKKILDMPVGTGRVLSYLKSFDCQVIGLDYTEEMLVEARKVMHPERHTLVQGNASATNFLDGEFDCLISLRFFHLFKRDERAPFSREFSRVIKPGGYIITSFTNGWYAGGWNWLKRILGFKTVEFGYPFEVSKLFPEWKVIAVRGNFLPKQCLLDKVPFIGQLMHTFTRVPPGNRLCWEIFYLLQKPDNL